MGSEGGLGQRGQVVHVEEARTIGVIVARQQQVHMVRRLETRERGRERNIFLSYLEGKLYIVYIESKYT